MSPTIYAGRNAQIIASVASASPFTYGWRTPNGSGGFVSLSTGSGPAGTNLLTMVLSNVWAATPRQYEVAVTNIFGSVTSSVASLTVVSPGVISTYEKAVASNQPVAFWRLDETNINPATGTAPAYDYYGGFTGVYGVNAFNGASPSPDAVSGPTLSGFETAQSALETFPDTTNSDVTVPALYLNTSTMTCSLWMYPANNEGQDTALFFCRGGTTASGFGYGNIIANELGYAWDNAPASFNWVSGLSAPIGVWSLVSWVLTPNTLTIYVMNTNGVTSANYTNPNPSQAFDAPSTIGVDTYSDTRTFNGTISDVALFDQALTPAQLTGLYNAAGTNTGSGPINTPVLSWAAPAAITYGAALGPAQLDATANVAGAFVYSPASGSVLTAGTQTLSVTFNPSNTTTYRSVGTNISLTVLPAPLSVSANNASRPYDTANPTFTGTISGVVNGDNITAAFSCNAVTNSPVGHYTITSTLVDPGDRQTNYTVTLTNGALTVALATPVVTWPAPAAIPYGAALGPSQLNASANAAGSFAYTPPAGTVLNVGAYPLNVAFTPADTTDYTNAAASNSLTVNPAPLTVTASNASQSYGQPLPVLGGTIIGVTNGDNITATYSTTATTNSPPGAYSIVPALVDPNNRRTNYTVTLNDGTLTIVTSAGGAYAAAVQSDNPVAFWQLNETNVNPATGTAPAYDYGGRFNGTYGTSCFNGGSPSPNTVYGPMPPAFPGFPTNNGALETFSGSNSSYVTVPALNLDTNVITCSMWIYPTASQRWTRGCLFAAAARQSPVSVTRIRWPTLWPTIGPTTIILTSGVRNSLRPRICGRLLPGWLRPRISTSIS